MAYEMAPSVKDLLRRSDLKSPFLLLWMSWDAFNSIDDKHIDIQ